MTFLLLTEAREDRLKVEQCDSAGVRLIVVPFYVTDLWTFLRLHLLRWFAVYEIYPAMLH